MNKIAELTDIQKAILAAIGAHPSQMSPILTNYMLRGEKIGRIAEKGLLESPHFGNLMDQTDANVDKDIRDMERMGLIAKRAGFYPALYLTKAGEAAL